MFYRQDRPGGLGIFERMHGAREHPLLGEQLAAPKFGLDPADVVVLKPLVERGQFHLLLLTPHLCGSVAS